MKFRVKRTSMYDDKKPCDEAKPATYPYYEIRTCTEQYFNERFSEREGLWRSKGSEHKTTKDGHISRRRENESVYSVSINSMAALLDFIEKHGDCVISIGRGYPSIEIYDDYRE